MYSKIPMPKFEWKDDDMAHSLFFFPFVGLVIAALVVCINFIAPFCEIPVAVRVIITLLIPLMITGGFHADGFMDTEDAFNSYAPAEKKLEILKDPHIGAFACFALVKWLLAYAAAVTAILINEKCDLKVLLIFGMIFVFSRGLCGLTSLFFDKARKRGMLYEETKGKRVGIAVALLIQTAAAAAVMICSNAVYAAVVILAFAVFTVYYRWKVYREFGGVTGDTAGFFVTAGEVFIAAALAVCLYCI